LNKISTNNQINNPVNPSTSQANNVVNSDKKVVLDPKNSQNKIPPKSSNPNKKEEIVQPKEPVKEPIKEVKLFLCRYPKLPLSKQPNRSTNSL